MKLILTMVLLGLALSIYAAPAGKPNILYILADDMGYADAGFNGCKDIQTPHLDKLAQAGAILKSFYVQPVCSPTRSALMTGRYPSRTGVYTVSPPLLLRRDASGELPVARHVTADAAFSPIHL